MHFDSAISSSPPVLTVTQLNRQVAQLLSQAIPRLWVAGEVSNFTQAASGHWYFSIKDDTASVRAVMFRGRAKATGIVPRPGERFEFCVNVTLYEPRGDYQVQVEALRRAGQGDLHEAFLRLKEKLAAEGLLDAERKRPCVRFPETVGIITSLAAAALQDVLSSYARRAPHVKLVIYPAAVQGSEAPGQLVSAIELANARCEVDTLLLVRGGGSIEDLWSFNNEGVARAVAASAIPVIAGVGHETDFTIVDFVADLRAPTPTAAAELSCESALNLHDQLARHVRMLGQSQERALQHASLRLDRAVALLVSPKQRIGHQRERAAALLARLQQAVSFGLSARRDALSALGRRQHRLAAPLAERPAARYSYVRQRLERATPQLQASRSAVDTLARRLTACAANHYRYEQQRLTALVQTLEAVSPSSIVQRGYAIVRKENGEIVKNALDLSVGEQLGVELAQGHARVQVVRASEP